MIDRRIKFRHIQCFVEICRQKSLKKAAERQYLTQPAVSKTLKELESIIGTQLLVRSRAGVSPTREGELFLHFAEMSVASLQQGINGIEQMSAGGKVRLAVGALPSVAARLMPFVVERLRELSQDITLMMADGPHDYLINRLRQGDLDLVIGRLGAPDQETEQPQEGLRRAGAQAGGDPASHAGHRRSVPLAGKGRGDGMNERKET